MKWLLHIMGEILCIINGKAQPANIGERVIMNRKRTDLQKYRVKSWENINFRKHKINLAVMVFQCQLLRRLFLMFYHARDEYSNRLIL